MVYAMDMIELRECEAWLNGVQANVNYNPTMDEIAQTGPQTLAIFERPASTFKATGVLAFSRRRPFECGLRCAWSGKHKEQHTNPKTLFRLQLKYVQR